MNKQVSPIVKYLPRMFSVLVLVALVFGAFPTGGQAAAPAVTCVKKYTVVAGDTMTSIALTNNITLDELAAANNMKAPYAIYVGDVLCIPASSTSSSSSSSSSDDEDTKGVTATLDGVFMDVKASGLKKGAVFYVKVRSYRALRFYGSWYKVGTLAMGKVTSREGSYRLPPALRDKEGYEVCLKNGTNDQIYCTIVIP